MRRRTLWPNLSAYRRGSSSVCQVPKYQYLCVRGRRWTRHVASLHVIADQLLSVIFLYRDGTSVGGLRPQVVEHLCRFGFPSNSFDFIYFSFQMITQRLQYLRGAACFSITWPAEHLGCFLFVSRFPLFLISALSDSPCRSREAIPPLSPPIH